VLHRPTAAMWVRAASAFRLDRRGAMIAAALMIIPLFDLVDAIGSGNVPVTLWLVCCLGGCIAAAFSLQSLRRAIFSRSTMTSFALAVAAGVTVMAAAANAHGHSVIVAREGWLSFLAQILIYFPALFVLEEVAFRGMLDRCFDDANTSRVRYWASAVFVAILWGLWHWPIVGQIGQRGGPAALLSLVGVHVLIGVPLAITWRTSGNLALPAVAHALIDAYRNVVLSG
jgi:membrane protease YdiL (CAAX protease family)